MKLLSHEIAGLVETAIRAAQADGTLPAFDVPNIDITSPKRAEHGDFATAIPMALAKPAKLNPFGIATAIANHMPTADYIGAVEVVHPGFINFRLADDWVRAQTETIIAEGERLWTLEIGAGQRAQVEFVSANPTGPLHIGRSRGAIVGDVMARLLQAAGYDVEREYYFNNAGVQMNNLAISLRIRYYEALGLPLNNEEPPYKGAYLADLGKALAAEQGDALKDADLQPFKQYAETQMFAMIRATLKRVDIHHDVFFNENSLYDSGAIWNILERLEQRGTIYKSATPEFDETGGGADDDVNEKNAGKGAATWFRSGKFGDNKDRVMVKANGEPTYTLPDIAYHVNKLERGFAVCVNILGADHFVQHQVVKYGLRALDMDASKIHVIIVQIVHLLKDGTPVKQSTRAGNFETLDDLIDQTSADAVRYMLLSRSSDAQMNFDVDLAVKQSNENPVYYVQYAYVRCAGIFREAALRGVNDESADVRLLGDAELKFLRKAMELGEVIAQAARSYEPHRIAFYALELANAFHPIFDGVRVLHTEVPPDVAQARLRFYRAAQVVLRRVLALMGMSAPEYM
ncbi:MAG: arginine--tRNA ligase [Chloroflexota bacterium]|nr:arginine--tRNA ligase [Chloroflexota bacterium]